MWHILGFILAFVLAVVGLMREDRISLKRSGLRQLRYSSRALLAVSLLMLIVSVGGSASDQREQQEMISLLRDVKRLVSAAPVEQRDPTPEECAALWKSLEERIASEEWLKTDF
jgi:hypothetical protein